eukprot:5174792-Pyramimonas_sp.AAC.1
MVASYVRCKHRAGQLGRVWDPAAMTSRCRDTGVQIWFEFEMVIKATTKRPYVHLDYFKLMAEGRLYANMDLLVEAMHAFTKKWQKDIGPKVRLGSITIPTPVPVVIIPKMWMELEASAKLRVEGSATIGFDYTEHVRVGTIYRAAWNEFRTLNKQSSKFNYHPLTVTFKGAAE